MKCYLAVGLVLCLAISLGNAALTVKYTCHKGTGGAYEIKAYFELAPGDKLAKVYDEAKPTLCTTDKTDIFKKSTGTPAGFVMTYPFTDATAASGACTVKVSATAYTMVLQTAKIAEIVLGDDKSYSIQCLKTPKDSKLLPAKVQLDGTTNNPSGTATPYVPTPKLEFLGANGAPLPNVAKITDKVMLKYSFTTADPKNPPGFWVSNCIAAANTAFTGPTYALLDVRGCGTGVIAAANGFKYDSALTPAPSYTSPLFQMFKFPGKTEVFFKCKLIFCNTAGINTCNKANQCGNTARRRRSVEMVDMLRVKRASGSAQSNNSVTVAGSLTIIGNGVTCTTTDKLTAKKGVSNDPYACLTSIAYLTTVVVLAVLVLISLAAALLFYRRAVDSHVPKQ